MPRLSAVFLVDADPKGLETLEYGFEGNGCRVTSSTDYAPPSAPPDPPPQVVVVAAREPSAAALDLARALRTGPVRVPVLMLGPPTMREEARATGAELLPMPVFVRDVLTAAKVLVGLPEADENQETELSGALSDYGLFYLLRTMLGLGRSGILQIERANRRGEIRFSSGEVTAAQVGSLQGTAALHHLLLWEEAALDLKLRPVVHRGAFNQRTEDLLEEAERFLRDFAHATRNLGPTRTVLVADGERAAQAGESVPTEVVPVLRLFDGQRALGDVIEDSPFRVFDTVRIVSRLVDLGILSLRETAPAVAVSPGNKRPPLEEWLNPAPAPVVRSSPSQSDSRSDRASRPAASVRSVIPSKDQRFAGNRRKSPRRDKTSEHGTVRQAAPAVTPLASPLATAARPAGPFSPTPSSSAMAILTPPQGTPTTGAAHVPAAPPPGTAAAPAGGPAPIRGELRSGSLGTPSALRPPPARKPEEQRSVLVDLPPEADKPDAVEGAAVGEAKPELKITTQPLARLEPAPRPASPPAASPPAVVPPAEVSAPAGLMKTRPTAGVMQARPLASAAPAGPKAGSIELDPALMAELVAIEMASAPATPPPVLKTPPPAVVETAATPAAKRPPAPEPDPGPTPLPVPKPAPAAAAAPAAPAVLAAAPAAAPAAAAPDPAASIKTPPAAVTATPPPGGAPVDGRRPKRPSSDFSALEKDFFAREADLYKEEKEESFDDLDRRRPR